MSIGADYIALAEYAQRIGAAERALARRAQIVGETLPEPRPRLRTRLRRLTAAARRGRHVSGRVVPG